MKKRMIAVLLMFVMILSNMAGKSKCRQSKPIVIDEVVKTIARNLDR